MVLDMANQDLQDRSWLTPLSCISHCSPPGWWQCSHSSLLFVFQQFRLFAASGPLHSLLPLPRQFSPTLPPFLVNFAHLLVSS